MQLDGQGKRLFGIIGLHIAGKLIELRLATGRGIRSTSGSLRKETRGHGILVASLKHPRLL